MVAVMNAAIDIEDPFNTKGVDGVYCNENLYEVEQVSALPTATRASTGNF